MKMTARQNRALIKRKTFAKYFCDNIETPTHLLKHDKTIGIMEGLFWILIWAVLIVAIIRIATIESVVVVCGIIMSAHIAKQITRSLDTYLAAKTLLKSREHEDVKN